MGREWGIRAAISGLLPLRDSQGQSFARSARGQQLHGSRIAAAFRAHTKYCNLPMEDFMLRITGLALVLSIAVASAAAADPGKRGRGGASQGDGGVSINIGIDLSDQQIIRDYFGQQLRGGRCPPGLAKKNNGCQPPGQAKQWAKGKRLPSGVIFHDLPRDLGLRLKVPDGARYVRVAADVLLIAVGTGMVLDAVEDLARL